MRYFNDLTERSGTLWERYRSTLIQAEPTFFWPVRCTSVLIRPGGTARLIYLWSTMRIMLGHALTNLVTRTRWSGGLGNTNARRLHTPE
jgi:hypothetical protein